MEVPAKIERTNRLAAAEQQKGPERIAAAQTVGVGSDGLHFAYCSAEAGEGNTLLCFLDTDTTGTEITVHFTLLGDISDLSDGHLSLVDGTPIPVMIRDGDWWCIIPIEGTEDCA